MQEENAGLLLIIGGNEDKTGKCRILRKFIDLCGGRESRIGILTTATELPQEVGSEYKVLFEMLGAKVVDTIHIDGRRQAFDRQLAERIATYQGLFFTGGDQLRLTSILGGTAVEQAIADNFRNGGVIAGTSAGASVMSHTMIVGGESSETPKKSMISMAEGMGLLNNAVIDQHFAQRGRINRLLAVIAQNPKVLGIGIDEDTALLVRAGGKCTVIGSQTITIADGRNIIHTNVSELSRFDPLAITNVSLHILPEGFGYDLSQRVPYVAQKQEDKS